MYATKTYAVDFTAIAAGDGYWGMKAGTEVRFSELTLNVNCYEGEDCTAMLNATHNADAAVYGLCYTDNGVEDALNAFMQQHAELSKLLECVDGSEQGMQDYYMLSCDAGLREGVEIATLQAVGFEVEDD